MTEINRIHVPVYTELLRNATYVERFDSKALGSMYRVLAAHIWRLDTTDTAKAGYRGRVFSALAAEYEAGNLVCYFDDKRLSELLGVTKRYIRKLRNQLVALGLAEAKKLDNKTAKYFYKLGEVVAPNSYGTLHEVMFIDKWLADILEVKRGRKTTPDFEKLLIKITKSTIDNNEVNEFSNNSLQELNTEILGKASKLEDTDSAIFSPEPGTTVPTTRNYSSSTPQRTDTVQDEKKGEKSTPGNKMKYKISPSPKGEVKKIGGSKNSENSLTDQPTLFGKPTQQDYALAIKEALTKNLTKLHSVILKAIKVNGIDNTRQLYKTALLETGITIPSSDTEFFTLSWEEVVRSRKLLNPQRAISADAFLYSWWMFHTIDRNKPAQRKNVSAIRSIFKAFTTKNSSDVDYVLNVLQYARKVLRSKGDKLAFAQPQHLYKALETFSVYYSEKLRKSGKDVQNTNSAVNVQEECPPNILNATDTSKMPLEWHIELLEKKEYEPKFLDNATLETKIMLFLEGYFGHTLIPRTGYRKEGIPSACWNKKRDVSAMSILSEFEDIAVSPELAECLTVKFLEQYPKGEWQGFYPCTDKEINALATGKYVKKW